jgi:hypothetical protein
VLLVQDEVSGDANNGDTGDDQGSLVHFVFLYLLSLSGACQQRIWWCRFGVSLTGRS